MVKNKNRNLAAGARAPDGQSLSKEDGGEGGIRTHGTRKGTPHFECGTIDHSATSPQRTHPERGSDQLVEGALLTRLDGGRKPSSRTHVVRCEIRIR